MILHLRLPRPGLPGAGNCRYFHLVLEAPHLGFSDSLPRCLHPLDVRHSAPHPSVRCAARFHGSRFASSRRDILVEDLEDELHSSSDVWWVR